MNYEARCYTNCDSVIPTSVRFSSNRIVLHFEDDLGVGQLVATSADGVTFAGTYGYPRPEPHREATFIYYDRPSDGGVALIGTWRERHANGGFWVIVLDPIG